MIAIARASLSFYVCMLKVEPTSLRSAGSWSQILEAIVQRCSVKKVFLKIPQNSQENTCVRVSFLIKLHACNFIKKEILAQVFSCEFCEISKNTFLYSTPLVAPEIFSEIFILILSIINLKTKSYKDSLSSLKNSYVKKTN